MNATVVERDLVDAIESTLFVFPAVPSLMHDLGIPGPRGRITKMSHPVANLADARADGRTTAVVQADLKTSAPICAKLGFRELCGLEIFVSTPH